MLWLVSYEMFFYVAIPLVITVLHLRARSATQRVVFFCGAALATAAYCAAFGGHVRLIMFVSGILLYETTQNKLLRAPGSVAGLAALVSGMLCTLLPLRGSAGDALKAAIIFAAFFVLCFTCVAPADKRLARAFSWTPLRWLGNMSYSYYLLHGLTLKAGFAALRVLCPPAERGGVFFWTLLPLMFALTLIPTALLFLTVERPFSLAPQRRRRGAGVCGERAAAILVGSAAPQATGRAP